MFIELCYFSHHQIEHICRRVAMAIVPGGGMGGYGRGWG